jgi:hypothetical protein
MNCHRLQPVDKMKKQIGFSQKTTAVQSTIPIPEIIESAFSLRRIQPLHFN